jgi:Protein of unknown function (DUF3072)
MGMTDRRAEKPTEEWVTGDEPMTGPQASYLETLAREAGEDLPDNLTKAEASELIERLQAATGRGDRRSTGTGTESGGQTPAGAEPNDDRLPDDDS